MPAFSLRKDIFAASGPVWRFRVIDTRDLDDAELRLLSAFVPNPAPGAESEVDQMDHAARERMLVAAGVARREQQSHFGVERRARRFAVMLTIGLIVGAIAFFVGLVGLARQAGGIPVGLLVIVLAALLVFSIVGVAIAWQRRMSVAEREYRQAVADFGAWVLSTHSPDPRLGGWATLWDLPGPWSSAVHPEIVELNARDLDFRRGDHTQNAR